MEENSESGHSGGRWRALPAHEERREGGEEVVRDGEEEEEIREGKERKIAQCKTDLSAPDCSQASLTRSLLPTSGQLASSSPPPPSSLHLLSSSLALICLLYYPSRTPHQHPIPGAGR